MAQPRPLADLEEVTVEEDWAPFHLFATLALGCWHNFRTAIWKYYIENYLQTEIFIHLKKSCPEELCREGICHEW